MHVDWDLQLGGGEVLNGECGKGKRKQEKSYVNEDSVGHFCLYLDFHSFFWISEFTIFVF